MHIRHFFEEDSSTLSYVIHDGRVGIIIDPVRGYDPKSGRPQKLWLHTSTRWA